MLIKLDQEKIDNIVKLQDKNYGTELAVVKPAKSGTELDKSLKLIAIVQNIGNKAHENLKTPDLANQLTKSNVKRQNSINA